MKKTLLAILATVAMVACSNDEIVREAAPEAIGFDNAFVENSTRANDLTAGNFDFGVYGSVINSQNQQGMIFTNQLVAANGTYSPLQYWIAGATYNFVAFAPYQTGDNATWKYVPTVTTAAENGTITFDNAKARANQDFLFATANKTTAATLTATPGKVGFTFDHVLSRVRFTFTNGFTSGGNIKLLVTDVHITDAYKEGKMAVPATTWTVEAGTNNENKQLNIDFNDVLKAEGSSETDARLAEGMTSSTEHFYLIPANASYNVTFTVALYQAGVLVDTYDRTATLSYNMQPGYSYDIKATLSPSNTSDEGEIFPIEFQVTGVNGWTNANVNMALEAVTVADAASLKAAVANGGDIRLTGDITLSGDELKVATGKNVNLDLNGKTLTVNALDPINNNGKMTIANGKVVANNGENTRRCIYNHGEMTINGVEFVQTYDKKGAAINNAGKMTINDATVDAVFYSIWNSGDNAELTINGGTYTTTNNVALRDTWAYAVTCLDGAKMTINGGSFVGNHGVIAAEGGEVVLNGGTYHCTATYTGNSDWTLYAADGGSIRYNAAACTVTSANPSGATYGNVTTL